MSNGLRYESGRDMPQGMQMAAARQFLCQEAGAMLAVLQVVDTDCQFCAYAGATAPCREKEEDYVCKQCGFPQCHCYNCTNNSNYKWCGAEEAMKRLAIMQK